MKKTEKTFEDHFTRLEQVVHALEEGNTTLDDSLALYSEGVELLKACHDQLANAKRKIALLTGVDAEGNPTVREFAEDDRTLEEKSETRGR
ncbi:MAG: exodeoxyribonuclease VII small subunit [Planctomycetia bacterium]|nr:exodeoxyribonuclease VII small subunit [Planctomycetia bacterium]